MNTYWLSFVGPRPAPGVSGFLGVCIVQGEDFADAIQGARDMECNPGGQVRGFQYPAECFENLPSTYRNRLLTKDEAHEADELMAHGIQ